MDRFSFDDDQQHQRGGGGDPTGGALGYDAVFNPQSGGGLGVAPSAPAAPSAPKTPQAAATARRGQPAGTMPMGAPPQAAPMGVPPAAPQPGPSTQGPGTGGAPAAQPGGDRASYAATKPYTQAVEQLRTTTDPQQQALLKDQLGRSLAQNFKNAGHDVKWQGDQLIVDGRPYVVGGGTGNTGIAGGQPAQIDQPQAAAAGSTRLYGTLDQNKLADPNHAIKSPKYQLLQAAQGMTSYNVPELLGKLQQQDPARWNGWEFNGTDKLVYRGNALDPRFEGATELDIIHDVDGKDGNTGWGFQTNLPAGAGGGHSFQPPSPIDIDGGGLYHTMGAEPTEPVAEPRPSWAATAPKYTPGEIGFDDIPGAMGDDDISGLQGRTDADVEELVSSLLKSGGSMNAGVVDQMKARSKDELAEMHALSTEQDRGAAAAMGIDDSKWFASQQAQAGRDRDKALVSKNRDIEIDAAKTNYSDKLQAGSLGASYGKGKADVALAGKSLQADTNLRRAALTGDRMALREQVNQRAAELGQSADKIQLDYTLAMMDDITKRYGIDVSKFETLKRLAQSDRQFAEDLAFRFAQLAQDDRQFGASYGLDLARESHRQSMDTYDRAFGVPGGAL